MNMLHALISVPSYNTIKITQRDLFFFKDINLKKRNWKGDSRKTRDVNIIWKQESRCTSDHRKEEKLDACSGKQQIPTTDFQKRLRNWRCLVHLDKGE